MSRSLAMRRLVLFAAVAGLVLPSAASAWPRFSPYVDLAGYPPPALAKDKRASGVRAVTLGFVTARESTACEATWGGYATYPATGAGAYRLADVRAFRRRGGTAVVSFGGEAGAELASVCPSADALAAAYEGVVNAYGARYVDFDIEGAALEDAAANARRDAAVVALQRARHVKVAFTLPVLPSGLPANALAVVRGARQAGVKIALVNVMAMDYGDDAAPAPDGKMGAYAIRAGTRTHQQLGVPLERIGVTPMIGINDVQTEKFTLADARRLRGWATRKHVGMLGMWELGRDAQCRQPTKSTQITCSGVPQSPWAFAHALG